MEDTTTRWRRRVQEQPWRDEHPGRALRRRAGLTGAGGAGEWAAPSWDEVVAEHSARVYRLAYRLTGNPHDAEDLTQEVFVRVFRSLDRYTPGTFEGWLHRITTNLFLDEARRKAKIRFDALADDAETALPSRTVTPDTAVLEGSFDDDVEHALAALPPDFRAAVVLCDIEGLSYEEIAGRARTSSSAPCARASTAAAACCARRSPTARPARAARATPVPPTCPAGAG